MRDMDIEPTLDEQADNILRDWAKSENISLRKGGIIDERRARTVREREISFASFFGRRQHGRDKS